MPAPPAALRHRRRRGTPSGLGRRVAGPWTGAARWRRRPRWRPARPWWSGWRC